MDIEENIKPLKILMSKYKQIDEMNNFDHELALVIDYTELSAIETLLTAYEKEKGENVKLRLQDIPLIEGELKAYKDRVNELKAELEKETEKNKELEDTLKQTQNSWYEDTKVIEKQSKEIEELKTTKKELTERVLRLESDKFWENVVSKDKIKAKIEEYKNKIKKISNKKLINEPEDTINITRYVHYISVLQSLLEKE